MAGINEASLSARLRRWTPARVGQGRIGSSLPTLALLAFELDHARARDAVHAELNVNALAMHLQTSGFEEPIPVRSQAPDRLEYLLRPDLGRALDEESRQRLKATARCDLAVMIADGLSALAPIRHAVPVLRELRNVADLGTITVIVATQARVALGDEIGGLLHADAVVVLIGERPGLSSPDSLGIYLTWAPRAGRTDADRNCISNVHPAGLPYAEAARRLGYLLSEARRLKLSGVALKDDSEGIARALSDCAVADDPS
jgi:ethanolamine ammonia-lyase small subunit